MSRGSLFRLLSVSTVCAVIGCQSQPPARGPQPSATSPAFISTIAGTGGPTDTGDGGPAILAGLQGPSELAIDSAGNLYFSERDGARVRRIDASGIITSIAGTGTPGFSGDGGPALSAQLDAPECIALDAKGDLFIADSGNNRVRMVDSSGIITTVAGTGEAGYSGDGGPAMQARLHTPVGVAPDNAGAVYIADRDNQRVRKVDLSTGMIVAVAGNGTAGFSGDGGPALSAELNLPAGLLLDASGNLYIGDSNNHRVRMVTGVGISTVAGTGAAGSAGDGGRAASAALYEPLAMTMDAAGTLFLADQERIRAVNRGGLISTAAGSSTAGFGGDGGRADRASLSVPTGVAVDAGGNLYIADYANNRIREASIPTKEGVSVRLLMTSDLSPSLDREEPSTIGTVLLRNTDTEPASHVTVSVRVPGFMDAPQECAAFDLLQPQELKTAELGVTLNQDGFRSGVPYAAAADVTVSYSRGTSGAAGRTTFTANLRVMPYSNRVQRDGVGLLVPDDVAFRAADRASADAQGGLLFSFSDASGALAGTVSRYALPPGTDLQVVLELWRRWAQDTWPGSQVTRGTDSTEASVPGGAVHMVRILPDGPEAVSIRVDSSGSAPADVERCRDVLRSGRLVPAGAEERIVADGPIFLPLDGAWTWYQDVPGGMMLRGTLLGKNAWIGIWRTSAADTAALAAQAGNFDVAAFDTWFLLDNHRVASRGSGYASRGGSTELYFVVANGAARYCIALTVEGTLQQSDYAAAADALRQVIFDTMRFPEVQR